MDLSQRTDRDMPPNYFIFLKIDFEYNAHIPAFHKRHSFIWGCSFSVSILVSLIKTFLLSSCDWYIISEIKKMIAETFVMSFVRVSFVVIEFFYRHYSAYNFFPANLYVKSQQWKHQNTVWNLFKVNLRSGVFVVNFEQISQIVLVFSLFTINK